MVTTSNNNAKLVSRWIKTSKQIQRRKFYIIEELFYIYNEENENSPISKLSFARNINKYIGRINDTYKLEKIPTRDRRKSFRYILMPLAETYNSKIRISSRKNDAPSPPTHTPSQTPTATPILLGNSSPPLLDNPNNSNCQNTSHQTLCNLLKKRKIDLPMSLSFFFGKDRAEGIKKERDRIALDINAATTKGYGSFIFSHLKLQSKRLKYAYLRHNGWKRIVMDYSPKAHFTEYEIFSYQKKAFYLHFFYEMIIKYYNTINNIKDIAALALLQANKNLDWYGNDEESDEDEGNDNVTTRNSTITCSKTLLRWFYSFRICDLFPNTSTPKSSKSKMPLFLSENPDAVAQIISYCKNNLSTITGEAVHSFIHHEVFPKLVETIQNERNDSEYSLESLFKEFRIRKLSLSTIYHWLSALGFKYQLRKKCYYVDNHESVENVRYRSAFISRYFHYELRCHRWIAIPSKDRDEMVAEGTLMEELGYRFEKNNETFYEFHVDDHEIFQQKCTHLPYGGYLSIRKPPNLKPLLILGQDECIFKQFIFTRGTWVLPDGTRQLVPKDEGQGVMLSSFCSRELGYGFNSLCMAILDEVNAKRENMHYIDRVASSMKFGSSLKPKLTSSPFVRELEYGNNSDGYWTYEHMVVQIEDCVDVLKHTHPQFDILFLLDHSNGHDRLQPDGLSLSKINIRHAGKQPKMRPSKLTSQEFGPFHTPNSKLQPGHIQSMVFTEFDQGPCYLNPREQIEQRLDLNMGVTKQKELTKSELVEILKSKGNDCFGSKKTLCEKCRKLGIPVHTQVPVVREGWVDKPKGALQILFERGWINPDFVHLYTAGGKKSEQSNNQNSSIPSDPSGCDYSINSLMKLQADFLNEVTLLQFHAAKLVVSVDRSPKCHPELAGEGIEYVWALAKLKYRRAPIGAKRSKEKFRKLVLEVTDPLDNLHIQRIRSCSKKARSYMKLYKAIEQLNSEDAKVVQRHSVLEQTMKLYSKMKKECKTHRSVIDLNFRDVKSIENSDIFVSNTIDQSRNKIELKDEMIGLLLKKMNSM